MMSSVASLMPVLLLAGIYYAESASASTWSLAHFTNYLSAMVRQNLPLGSSLSAYAQDLPGWRWGKRKALLDLADTVDNGLLLADAFDRHPAVFPRYYRALVRAGENGGNLAVTLGHLVRAADASGRTARMALGYAAYPAFLSAIVLGVSSIVFGRMLQLFSEMCYDEGSSPARFLRPGFGLATLAFVLFVGLLSLLLLVPLVPWRPADRVPALSRLRSWLTWASPATSKPWASSRSGIPRPPPPVGQPVAVAVLRRTSSTGVVGRPNKASQAPRGGPIGRRWTASRLSRSPGCGPWRATRCPI